MFSKEEKQFILDHQNDDVQKLLLKYHRKTDLDYPFLIQQIDGKNRIKNKIPSFYQRDDILYPPQLNLEQSSSEHTALYKASLAKGKTGVDLTGGFGIDSSFLAPNFITFHYVERNGELLNLVEQNFRTQGLKHIETHNSTSEAFLEKDNRFDFVFIDPSRRTSKGKVIFLEDYEPNVVELYPQLKSCTKKLLIKTSPMLDIKDVLRKIKGVQCVHVVGMENEVKELLFEVDFEAQEADIITASISKSCQVTTIAKSQLTDGKISFNLPQKYLFEPNPMILKAGIQDNLAATHKLSKLSKNSHLYTSDLLLHDFPGRVFEVKEVLPYQKKELANIPKANITVRNFPYTVEQIRKKMKIKEGGDIYLFATTLINEKPVILNCIKVH